jgi:hypothetical protein
MRVGIAMLMEEERKEIEKYIERKEVKSLGSSESILNKDIYTMNDQITLQSKKPIDVQLNVSQSVAKTQNLETSTSYLRLDTAHHLAAAFPLPGAASNLPFHLSSCLNSVTAAMALGFPWSGSAPPSSNACFPSTAVF